MHHPHRAKRFDCVQFLNDLHITVGSRQGVYYSCISLCAYFLMIREAYEAHCQNRYGSVRHKFFCRVTRYLRVVHKDVQVPSRHSAHVGFSFFNACIFGHVKMQNIVNDQDSKHTHPVINTNFRCAMVTKFSEAVHQTFTCGNEFTLQVSIFGVKVVLA